MKTAIQLPYEFFYPQELAIWLNSIAILNVGFSLLLHVAKTSYILTKFIAPINNCKKTLKI